MLDQAIINNDQGVQYQPSASNAVKHTLSETSENKPFTASVIVSAALKMAKPETFQDHLTDVEDDLLEQISDEADTDADTLRETISECVESDISEGYAQMQRNVQHEDPDETSQLNLYLMPSMRDNMPHGAGETIAHALAYVIVSPWSSRPQYINDLQQLLGVARGNSVSDSSDFVAAVESGDASEWDVSGLHSLLAADSDEDEEWWKSDDFNYVDLLENGTDIPKTRTQRRPVAEHILNKGEDEVYSILQIYNLIKSAFDDYGEVTQRKIVREVNLEEINGGQQLRIKLVGGDGTVVQTYDDAHDVLQEIVDRKDPDKQMSKLVNDCAANLFDANKRPLEFESPSDRDGKATGSDVIMM